MSLQHSTGRVPLDGCYNSLRNALEITQAKLIISIDNQAPGNYPVRDLANRFEWPFGEKEVRYHPEHLGLRRHILKCGDVSLEYGSVIILEDDLYVSPYFYNYAVKALEFYGGEPRIGGISLYNQPIQEITQYPFTPINDPSDVYFLQFPSSLGQVWTADQWSSFRSWYGDGRDLSSIVMPGYIKNRWPETSWKKYFCGYLVDKDKYFVFPRISLTTNFNDPGSNLKKVGKPPGTGSTRIFGGPYRFVNLAESYSVYDAYLELEPWIAKRWNPLLAEYDITMDLYGTKDLEAISSSYVITLKDSSNPVRSFRRAMKPHEMNILFDLQGGDFHL